MVWTLGTSQSHPDSSTSGRHVNKRLLTLAKKAASVDYQEVLVSKKMIAARIGERVFLRFKAFCADRGLKQIHVIEVALREYIAREAETQKKRESKHKYDALSARPYHAVIPCICARFHNTKIASNQRRANQRLEELFWTLTVSSTHSIVA